MKSSRRRFLQSALVAPWAARLGGWGLDLWGEPIVPAHPVKFSHPNIIRYDSHCFTIHGKDTVIHSGSFHYCRCPQQLWRDRLLKFKRAGFNAVMSYVFWNYHEPVRGQCDLSEFEAYARAVQEMGLWLIARPGPYVCAEWTDGGFPDWVAAMRFPLRSDHPESIRTSQHWYNEVLPVIRKYQIIQGGPIIIMQLENEYNYWQGVSNPQKRAYVTALAEMAWKAGIDIPLFTCWTQQVREKQYPVMDQIMDSCNFYPRWKIDPSVPRALALLREQQPEAPLQVTELQGGWFSRFGGKLSVDQEGVSAAQLNAVTKTVLEQGVTSYNYYMGFGGTNFDWAAKTITTTYDYAAPIREPGGLWEKYYAARGIAEFLNLYGDVLTRAKAVRKGCASANPAVSVRLRQNGNRAVAFVRTADEADQNYKMTLPDPASPSHRLIQIPRQGELTLSPLDMKMLPVQVPFSGGTLRYSTAEVIAHGSNFGRDFLVVYDDPGHAVEIALASPEEPQVEGGTLYQFWDKIDSSFILGIRVEKQEKFLWVNHRLLLVVLPRELALRTWAPEYTTHPLTAAGGHEPKAMQVPWISDAALLFDHATGKNSVQAHLDFRPGEHDLTAILPPLPSKCRVDGVLTNFHYDRHWRTARVHLSVPTVPMSAVDISSGQFWVERFDPQVGEWEASVLRTLDGTGLVPYGYVKYRAELPAVAPSEMLFISSYAEDEKKVFLNGRLIPELSNAQTGAQVGLASLLGGAGKNVLEISYEAFGTPNFGPKLGELKGIASVKVGSDSASARPVEGWQMARFLALAEPHGLNGRWPGVGWQPSEFSPAAEPSSPKPAYTWCRATFDVPKLPPEWFAPFRLTLRADCDALIYLNQKFIGRYVTAGPQEDFYLPEPFLNLGGSNSLVLLLAYTDHPRHLRTLRVSPYDEFVTRRTRVEFEWQKDGDAQASAGVAAI